MSNYYGALRKIMSDGNLATENRFSTLRRKPKKKPSLKELEREATRLEANKKLSPQEIQNIMNKKLDSYTTDDFVDEVAEALFNESNRRPVYKEAVPESHFVAPKEMSMTTNQRLPREEARSSIDPYTMQYLDWLEKYAKDDSLQRGRDKLKLERDIINSYADIAYKEGFHDPESRRILFNAMDRLGTDYEDAIKMIKGDISGLTENPRFANDPKIREAFENYLYEKGFPIDKIDQLNKVTGGSIVSREALTEREKMLRLLEDIEAQTGIDKMFSTKLRDDASAAGGVMDETPVEMRGMSQMGRRQMSDDLKDKLVAYRTRKGSTTGVDIDEVLLNPYLSTKDLSKSKRVQNYLREEEAGIRNKYNINPETDIKPLRDIHPQKGEKRPERLRASDIKDRSEWIEEAINNRYGSVDNLRKINRDIPEGAEHTVDEANSWLNAYDDAMDAERRWMDFEDNRHAESIADQFEDPAVIERRNSPPRSRDYGGETLYLRDIRSGRKKRKDSESIQARKRMLIKAASDIKGEGRNIPVRKFTSSGKPAGHTNVKEKQLLREMYPVTKRQKIDKDLVQPRISIGKWDKPATKIFIKNVARQNGFRFSIQQVEDMLGMSKQEVIDFIEDLANP